MLSHAQDDLAVVHACSFRQFDADRNGTLELHEVMQALARAGEGDVRMTHFLLFLLGDSLHPVPAGTLALLAFCLLSCCSCLCDWRMHHS